MRWLRALTPVTYRCKLLGIPALAAFLQPEFSRPGCQNGSNCVNQLNAAARRALPKPGTQEPFHQWCLDNPDEVGKTLALCTGKPVHES